MGHRFRTAVRVFTVAASLTVVPIILGVLWLEPINDPAPPRTEPLDLTVTPRTPPHLWSDEELTTHYLQGLSTVTTAPRIAVQADFSTNSLKDNVAMEFDNETDHCRFTKETANRKSETRVGPKLVVTKANKSFWLQGNRLNVRKGQTKQLLANRFHKVWVELKDSKKARKLCDSTAVLPPVEPSSVGLVGLQGVDVLDGERVVWLGTVENGTVAVTLDDPKLVARDTPDGLVHFSTPTEFSWDLPKYSEYYDGTILTWSLMNLDPPTAEDIQKARTVKIQSV